MQVVKLFEDGMFAAGRLLGLEAHVARIVYAAGVLRGIFHVPSPAAMAH